MLMNMIRKSKEFDIPVCSEWNEFQDFLPFYLESTGLSLEDVLKPRTQWSYYHAEQ